MFCSQCGKHIRDDAKFCSFCGDVVHYVPQSESAVTAPPVEPVRSTPPVEPAVTAPPVEPVRSTPPVEPVMTAPPVEPERKMAPPPPPPLPNMGRTVQNVASAGAQAAVNAQAQRGASAVGAGANAAGTGTNAVQGAKDKLKGAAAVGAEGFNKAKDVVGPGAKAAGKTIKKGFDTFKAPKEIGNHSDVVEDEETRENNDAYEHSLFKRLRAIGFYAIFYTIGIGCLFFIAGANIAGIFIALGVISIPTWVLYKRVGLTGLMGEMFRMKGVTFYVNGWYSPTAKWEAQGRMAIFNLIAGVFLTALGIYITPLIILLSSVTLLISSLKYKSQYPYRKAGGQCAIKLGILWAGMIGAIVIIMLISGLIY